MEERMEIEEKFNRLKGFLRELGGVAVAYSGGVDSTFLLKAAHDVLGDNAVAVTVEAAVFPKRESEETAAFCRQEGIRQFVVPFHPLEVQGFAQNPPERCYICKRALFDRIVEMAEAQKICHVAEGSNVDDLGDYRPGMKAVAEMGILSPLREAGLKKEEIRILAKEMGLAVWNKPSLACLASRFVYGERITEEKLSMIDRAEQLLYTMGFSEVRVRLHGQMARIEVPEDSFSLLVQKENRVKIVEMFKQFGFTYVTMDLAGYRTGSMNATLK